MKRYLLIFFLLLQSAGFFAQNPTVGLLYHSGSETDGYTLFTPETSRKTFLINNCGEVINQWQFNELPALTCYLLENGNLLRAGKDTLEIRDWNNQKIWSYALTDELGLNQHHDIEPMPNGNVLCIVYDDYSSSYMHANGKDTLTVPGVIRFDKIIELQPVGADSAEVVWEWRFVDHLIQDFDATKLNYGVVANHPELLDLNFSHAYLNDFTHLNAIDYNANLDQIMLSARSLSEIYIIDHSTTTAEASGHAGGNSGKGGDFLWRWGNPLVYRAGTSNNQKLFLQHDCKWIEDGFQDAGKITVFNNLGVDGAGTASSIHVINPIITNGAYQLENNQFTPQTYEWSWSGSILGTVVYEDKKSGTHALPNGHFMICETSKGRISEIDRSGNVHWSYVNPIVQNAVYDQFSTVQNNINRLFRGEKYLSNFIGFTGKNLTPQGILENENSVSDSCSTASLAIGSHTLHHLTVQNPVINKEIRFSGELMNETVTIYDLNGQVCFQTNDFTGMVICVELQSGIYFLKTNGLEAEMIKILVN